MSEYELVELGEVSEETKSDTIGDEPDGGLVQPRVLKFA